MKKVKAIVLAAVAMIVTSCGTQGNILGDILQGGTLGNVIISVIGAQKVTAQDLIGAWNYSGPGCAFTSENLLAKEYPQYDWQKNKGYPTKKHREAIRQYGTTPYHRMSYNLLGDGQLSLQFED